MKIYYNEFTNEDNPFPSLTRTLVIVSLIFLVTATVIGC